MRKIVVFNMVSVDGYYAGSNDDISWHNVDDEFNQFAVEHTKEFGCIIFGRKTYQLFESFWPVAMNDPKMSPEDKKIGKTINDLWKLVFSKTLKEVTWNNSKLISEIDPEEIKKWKQYDGKDLVIFGSGQIVQQLANMKLIDEYRLMVNPLILSEGKLLFEGVKRKNLKLLKTKEFKNGNILLYYQVRE